MNVLEMRTTPGDHITDTIKKALALLEVRPSVEQLLFVFNDLDVYVNRGDTSEQVAARYQEAAEARMRAYRESPEAKAEAAKQEQQRVDYQAQADTLMIILPDVRHNLTRLVRWLQEFSVVADFIGVSYDRQLVIRLLEEAGYTESAHVGQQDFTTDEVGRYIVGQAINCLRVGPGIHPGMTAHWAEDYFKRLNTEV